MSVGHGFRDEFEPELLERVRQMQPMLREHARVAEQQRRVSAEVIKALDDAKIWAITVPRRWGGLGVSSTTMARVGAELAKGCASTAWVYYILSTGSWMASLAPDALQRDVFSDGIPRVCGGGAPPGSAVPVKGGYIVNGRWGYTSGSQNANWGFYYCVIKDPKTGDRPGALIYVPMSDIKIEADWHSAGMKGTGSHTSVATDLFVPEHRLLPPETPHGFHAADKQYVGEPSDYWPQLPLLRATILGPLVGMAEAVLEMVSNGTKKRGIVYTCYTRQTESQVVQRQIGESTVKIQTARLIMERATRALDAVGLAGQPMEYLERARNKAETSLVVELLTGAVDKLMYIAGSSAFMESHDAQRYWRDLNVACRHANLLPDVGYEIYGKARLGIEPNIAPPNWI